jgi:hypothetical protein
VRTDRTLNNAPTRRKLVRAYGDLVQLRINEGFMPYLATFMFSALPGGPVAIIRQMQREIERVYATFVTRVVRRPRSSTAVDRLPILMAFADLPVFKRARQHIRDVTLNDGLHYNGVLLVPPRSRLRVSADEHFATNQSFYASPQSRLARVDVRPIESAPDYVTGYAMKTVRSGRVDYDDGVLILPKSATEMSIGR